ncbi:hypothetical protein PMAYCL1PPCAC_21514 [Pristionchus mayeri]|uniref:Uncharacterized protein n=1 Tax=Pristionchus mayeri TaxID=1317129 RepID=A0AAN5CVE5_9BILA|nr:hypothetical protein PMAYCL1PPCAC_21514 [Pristionchus mayeri]
MIRTNYLCLARTVLELFFRFLQPPFPVTITRCKTGNVVQQCGNYDFCFYDDWRCSIAGANTAGLEQYRFRIHPKEFSTPTSTPTLPAEATACPSSRSTVRNRRHYWG